MHIWAAFPYSSTQKIAHIDYHEGEKNKQGRYRGHTDVGKDPAKPRPTASCLRIWPRLRNHWSNATRPAVTGCTFASTTDRVAAGLCSRHANGPRSRNPHEHRRMNAETGTVVHRRRRGSELECRTRLTCRGVVSCFPAFVVQAAGCGKPGMLSEEDPHILGAQTLPNWAFSLQQRRLLPHETFCFQSAWQSDSDPIWFHG